ncbi:response regulator transcription factor [Hyphomonas johnsonii]|uniref:Putative two-component response regulator, CheY-like protein n=1 Tax=Hyphomonas johnsonii MHS-2 TaxID=1280950 RepID=A0A059FU20_9PROT|nr:response regulator [Hyphomonas johnsonii]KCZ94082.1 Putative two-component response regulator, CheY-like protein [Hyphomonas johnsonii MHS-2]
MAIVEDDDAVRQALSDLLQVLGLNCSAFDRAEPFLAEYAPGRFDSLITDINMPGVDGLQLQERLRACGSTMPVIFITSVLDALTRARALDGGAHAFLTKPVSDDVLIHHLKSALNWNPDAGDDAGWSQSDV